MIYKTFEAFFNLFKKMEKSSVKMQFFSPHRFHERQFGFPFFPKRCFYPMYKSFWEGFWTVAFAMRQSDEFDLPAKRLSFWAF